MVIAVLLYINLQALDGKIDQLKDEFSKRLSDQQKQIIALEVIYLGNIPYLMGKTD
jgi:hypothetical protein